jgi:hypothetical protein
MNKWDSVTLTQKNVERDQREEIIPSNKIGKENLIIPIIQLGSFRLDSLRELV